MLCKRALCLTDEKGGLKGDIWSSHCSYTHPHAHAHTSDLNVGLRRPLKGSSGAFQRPGGACRATTQSLLHLGPVCEFVLQCGVCSQGDAFANFPEEILFPEEPLQSLKDQIQDEKGRETGL